MTHIHKGDTVTIRTGKDRGKSGKVVKVFPKEDKVIIEGLNLYKKHVRPKRQGEKGEIVQVPRPLVISNVMFFCSKCDKGTRVGYKHDGDTKVRFCKKCETTL